MTRIRLIADGGHLCFPTSDDGEPSLLMYRYSAGDIDLIPWPLVSEYRDKETLERDLASALYDERECGKIPVNAVVELPDGTVFDFDNVLARRK